MKGIRCTTVLKILKDVVMPEKKDSLGDRMKTYYEKRTQTFLPRRSYSILRLDGKAFHTYTRGLNRPFDNDFMNHMDETAKYLCANISGAQFAFVQSDEISILVTDFKKLTTQAWFDNNVQKMVSVSASLATAKFNELRTRHALLQNQENFYNELDVDIKIANDKGGRRNKSRALQSNQQCFNEQKLAVFDSRVFTVPCRTEVENYFIWRQQDTVRNSISSVAQSMFSQKELHGVSTKEMQELIFKKSGVNWNNYNAFCKRGRLITKKLITANDPDQLRTHWVVSEPVIFSKEREQLQALIPNIEDF